MTDKIRLIYNKIENRIDEICEDGFVLKENQQEYETLTDLEDFIDSFPKEHANKDLEEEIGNYIKDNFFGSGSMGFFSNRTKQELNSIDVANIARHFAEWQEKKMLGIAEAFYQQGRHEQEQEMMKDAVEAEVMYPASSSTLQIRYKLPKNTKLKYGDKVKIIIVKNVSVAQ